MKGFVYILKCSDGSYYVGSTTNLEVRVEAHKSGEGGDYTARRRPLECVYSEEFETRHDAFVVERQVKGWSRAKKEALIRRDYDALPELAANAVKRQERQVLRQAQDANESPPQ
jgi:putative endonuclease